MTSVRRVGLGSLNLLRIVLYFFFFGENNAHFSFCQVFNGSKSNNDVQTVYLPELTKLRFLRLKPTKWHAAIALRMEIYGCMKGK